MTHRDIEDGMGFGGLVESPEERRARKSEESKLGERLGPRLAIGSAIEEVMGCLPRDYAIYIHLTYGSVSVTLSDRELGSRHKITSKTGQLSDAIRDALLKALDQIE